MVLVLGSERTGPVAQWAQAQRVTIPQRRFDSLNVAMAGHRPRLRAQPICGAPAGALDG